MASQSRPPNASESGGLIVVDEEDTRSVVMEIIKSLGKKLMQGDFMDIMRVSRPASISYPMTYLQAAVQDFSYCLFLEWASSTQDPIRRLQLVTAFMISGLHINPMKMKNKPPLNPILGETYSSQREDGTLIWLEQTCHHPPISNWEMHGPNGSYTFMGHGTLVAGLSGPNTLRAYKRGKHIVKFPDGGVIEYTTPHMNISGLVYGDRTVNFIGQCEVKDPVNMIKCDITFGGYNGWGKWFKSKLSSFFSSKKAPSDFFEAVIKQYSDNSDKTIEICKGGGSWLEYVEFNQEKLWQIGMETGGTWIDSETFLPSDSRCRPDLGHLLNRDIPNAQAAKDSLENLQRHDRALRKSHK